MDLNEANHYEPRLDVPTYTQTAERHVVVALSLEAALARGMMEECDVISVVTELMVGSWFGSRCDGGV
jgi:hypothetical protein